MRVDERGRQVPSWWKGSEAAAADSLAAARALGFRPQINVNDAAPAEV